MGTIVILSVSARMKEPAPDTMARPMTPYGEDWTRVLEVSARRRIQNRISQRNHSEARSDTDSEV
jgi:hypothetical protein